MDYELLAGVPDRDRDAVLAAAARRSYRRGEAVFHEGDAGDTVHLVAEGRVAVRVSTPEGDVATLRVLGPGDLFGEQCLLDAGARRSATIVALEPVRTLVLTRAQFDDLRRHRAVDDVLVRHLARQVRLLSEQVAESLYVPAEARVLRRLLDVETMWGNGVVPLTQEELETLAGTARATANRVLQQVAADGLVALGRGRVEIIDRESLARRAR
jgi:CRP-like cAMP-binding protein